MSVLGREWLSVVLQKSVRGKLKWPKRDDNLIALTEQQINCLLDSYDIRAMKSHKKLHYKAVFLRC